LAKLGTPTKDENGRLIQRWYPEVGDIRPEGLEFLYFGSWYASREIGQPVTQDHCDQATYRIPSAYIPPSGWYCVGDDETVMEGDQYHIDDRQGDIGNGHYGCIVSKFRDAFGGWVLREPQEHWTNWPELQVAHDEADVQPATVSDGDKEQPCKIESADGTTTHVVWEEFTPRWGQIASPEWQYLNHGRWRNCEPDHICTTEWKYQRPENGESCKSSRSATSGVNTAAERDGSKSQCPNTTGRVSDASAPPVAAPVAWQFPKRPMERNVDHWLSLVAGKDTIQEGDERWTHVESRWKPWTVFFGEVLEDECPCRRPVYAPLPTRLEDVPDGRVIRIEAAHFFKWSVFIVHWEVVNGFVSLTDTDISYRPFTITDHVAELRPIE
jgi:hypothetical protein